MAPKTPGQIGPLLPYQKLSVCVPHPRYKIVPLVESKGRATGTRRQSGPLVSSKLRSEIWVTYGHMET